MAIKFLYILYQIDHIFTIINLIMKPQLFLKDIGNKDIKQQIEVFPQSTLYSNQSQYLDRYKQMLNLSSIGLLDQNQIAQKLIQDGIKFNPYDFHQKMRIIIDDQSHNYEAIKINAKYGPFNININLINIDKQATIIHFGQSFSGSYGNVYKYCSKETTVAIKSIGIIGNTFQMQFVEVIKEYLLLSVASSLQIGPKLIKIFGFDIIIFRDALVFTMQFCKIGKYEVNAQVALSKDLHSLHLFNIIHMDIKPENVGYSQYFNKPIFIDFGLSAIIKQSIGQKTFTNFSGSMHFCSTEMLQLFSKDEYEFVDLYYNDATCFIKTINNLKSLQKQVDEDIVDDMLDNFFSDSKRYNAQIRQIQLLLTSKYILFQFSCNIVFNSLHVSKFIPYMKHHKKQINKFILELSQSVSLIAFYNIHLIDNKGEYLIKTVFTQITKERYESEESPSLFQERYLSLKKIQNDQYIHHQIDRPLLEQSQELLDKELLKLLHKGIYHLALIKFIKINSRNKKFNNKIKACKIFNQINQITKNVQMNDIQIYRKTIEFIFDTAIKFQEKQSLQTLKNCIQTVAILQIVQEEKFIETYNNILDLQISFFMKISVIFEFITSLQFVREKYKKRYRYEYILKIFMDRLNQLLKGYDERIKTQNQRIIFNKIIYVINENMFMKQVQNHKFTEILNDIKYENCSYSEFKLNQALFIYIYSGLIVDSLLKLNFCVKDQLELLIIMANKCNSFIGNFTYINFTLAKVAEMTYLEQVNEKIYRLFYEQLRYFQQHKYFDIYLHHKISMMKNICSQQMIQYQRGEVLSEQSSKQEHVNYQQIFEILNYIVKNNAYFHSYLGFLLINNPSIYYSHKLGPYLINFIINNKQKITKLSNNYHNTRIDFARTPMLQIQVISNIFEIISARMVLPQSQWLDMYIKLMQNCQETIKQISNFEYKVKCMINIRHIYANYLQIQGFYQASFLSIVEMFVLYCKNNQLLQSSFNIIVHLVRTWCQQKDNLRDYDLIQLLYQFIKSNDNYRFCLTQIRVFNIYFYLYVHVSNHYLIDEFFDFILNLVKSLFYVRSVNTINKFYYTTTKMVEINTNQANKFNFIQFHQQIIKQFCSLNNEEALSYTALYLSALLQIQVSYQIKVKMFIKICQMIGFIDKYSKSIIFNTYYGLFVKSIYMPERKKKYLSVLQLKNTSQKSTLKNFIKTKAKYLPRRNILNNIKISLFNSSMKSYHLYL